MNTPRKGQKKGSSKAPWTRREVFRAGAALALSPVAGSLAGALTACRRPQLRPELEAVVAEIQAGLGETPVEPASLTAFAEDYLLHQAGGHLTPMDEVDLPRRFLLSSDLFDADRDTGSPAVYVVFYDPYWTPCSNRLAQTGGLRGSTA